MQPVAMRVVLATATVVYEGPDEGVVEAMVVVVVMGADEERCSGECQGSKQQY